MEKQCFLLYRKLYQPQTSLEKTINEKAKIHTEKELYKWSKLNIVHVGDL